eukprot:jgi/Ulvmu1/5661/UM024_0008.1
MEIAIIGKRKRSGGRRPSRKWLASFDHVIVQEETPVADLADLSRDDMDAANALFALAHGEGAVLKRSRSEDTHSNDAHLGCSSQSAPRKERMRDSADVGASTRAPGTDVVVPSPAAALAHATGAAPAGDDCAALAYSQALYKRHLQQLLLQTLQWNNCVTADGAAAAAAASGNHCGEGGDAAQGNPGPLPGSAALGPAGLPICMVLPQQAQQAQHVQHVQQAQQANQAQQAQPRQGCAADGTADHGTSSGSQGTRQDVGRGGGVGVAAASGLEAAARVENRDGDSSSQRGGSGTSDSEDALLQDRAARHIYISRMIERAATRSRALAVSNDEGVGSGGEEGEKSGEKGAAEVAAQRQAPPTADPVLVKEEAAEMEQPAASAAVKPEAVPAAASAAAPPPAAAPQAAAAADAAAVTSAPPSVPAAVAQGVLGLQANGAAVEGLRPDSAEGGSVNAAALAQFLGSGAAAQQGAWPQGMVLQHAQVEAVHAALKQNPGQQLGMHPMAPLTPQQLQAAGLPHAAMLQPQHSAPDAQRSPSAAPAASTARDAVAVSAAPLAACASASAVPFSMAERPFPPQLQQLPLQQQQQFLAAAQAQITRMTQDGMMQGFSIPQGFMHGGAAGMSGGPRLIIPAQGVPNQMHPMLAQGGQLGFVNGGGGYLRAYSPVVGGAGCMPQHGGAPGMQQAATTAHRGAASSAPDEAGAGAGIAVPLMAMSHAAGIPGHTGQISMPAGRVSMPMTGMFGMPGGIAGGNPGVQHTLSAGAAAGMGGTCMQMGGVQNGAGGTLTQQGPVGVPAAVLQGGGFVVPAQGIAGGMCMPWPQGRLVCMDGRLGHASQAMPTVITRRQ